MTGHNIIKNTAIKSYRDGFNLRTHILFFHYTSFSETEWMSLKDELHGIEIAKQTLFKQALEKTPYAKVRTLFQSTTGIVVSESNTLNWVKSIINKPNLIILGGIFNNAIYTANQITSISTQTVNPCIDFTQQLKMFVSFLNNMLNSPILKIIKIIEIRNANNKSNT